MRWVYFFECMVPWQNTIHGFKKIENNFYKIRDQVAKKTEL